MRAWGKQGFLNDPDHEDSGWFKFSVRPSKREGDIGMSYLFKMADCHGQIDLDFWTTKASKQDNGEYREKDLKAVRSDVKKRLKKVRLLRNAVTAAMDKFEEALIETDARAAVELEKLSRVTIDT